MGAVAANREAIASSSKTGSCIGNTTGSRNRATAFPLPRASAPALEIVSATIECDKEGKLGTGGKVTLRSGETIVAEGRFEKQIYARFTVNETFDVGCDTITPVSSLYESPFAFTGTIKRVMVDLSDRSFDELAVAVKAKMAMAT